MFLKSWLMYGMLLRIGMFCLFWFFWSCLILFSRIVLLFGMLIVVDICVKLNIGSWMVVFDWVIVWLFCSVLFGLEGLIIVVLVDVVFVFLKVNFLMLLIWLKNGVSVIWMKWWLFEVIVLMFSWVFLFKIMMIGCWVVVKLFMIGIIFVINGCWEVLLIEVVWLLNIVIFGVCKMFVWVLFFEVCKSMNILMLFRIVNLKLVVVFVLKLLNCGIVDVKFFWVNVRFKLVVGLNKLLIVWWLIVRVGGLVVGRLKLFVVFCLIVWLWWILKLKLILICLKKLFCSVMKWILIVICKFCSWCNWLSRFWICLWIFCVWLMIRLRLVVNGLMCLVLLILF